MEGLIYIPAWCFEKQNTSGKVVQCIVGYQPVNQSLVPISSFLCVPLKEQNTDQQPHLELLSALLLSPAFISRRL